MKALLQPNSLEKIEEKIQYQMRCLSAKQVEKKTRERQVIESDESIRELKNKIHRAEVSRMHAVQITEKQARELEELQSTMASETKALQQGMLRTRSYEETLRIEASKKAMQKQLLNEQIKEKQTKLLESREDWIREKAKIDAETQKQIDEDLARLENDRLKKRQNFQVMQEDLQEKEMAIQARKLQEKQELSALKDYAEKFENRKMEQKDKVRELEETKAKIYERICREQEAARREREEMESLREQLLLEETKEKERARQIEMEAKRIKLKEELKRWEDSDRLFKESKKREEKELEENFRQKLLRDFQEKERLDQKTHAARRAKELEFRRQIDALWAEKRRAFEVELQEELERRQQEKERIAEEQAIIERERRRLIEESLPRIKDFCSPSIIREFERTK